ncbi:MAG: leucine-rich repeat domain-containing protein, partial [Clostridia bacterium]|nr:leucine-rich repeat domain-containing protein [Clostridia bacterium]
MKTGKKFLTLMLACAMVTSTAYMSYSVMDSATVSVSAAEKQTTSDGWEYEVKSDGTATITGYSKKSGDLIIPSTVDGKTVTEIGWMVFYGQRGYQSVTIPGTVKKIDGEAFRNCTGLQKIDIQNGVELLEGRAFDNCTGIKSITLPDSIKKVGQYA